MAIIMVVAAAAPAQSVTFLDSFGSFGSGAGQFSQPIGVATNDVGQVFVVDSLNQRVQRFDAAGSHQLSFGSLGSGPGQFANPRGIAVSNIGRVYVTELGDRIQRFDASGSFQLAFGSLGTAAGQFNDPWAVALNGAGQVYVADTSNNRVQRFDADGNHQLSFGSLGAGPGQFDRPFGVAVNSSGQVYVADALNHRVQRFDADGNHQISFGSGGSGPGQFDFPIGIAVSSTGLVYVTDTNNNRVQRFDANGNHQLSFGSSGSGAGQFSLPLGLAVSSTGLVYAVDQGNNRVHRWFAPSEWTVPHTHTFGAVTIGESFSLTTGKNLLVTGTTTISGTGALTLAGGQFRSTGLNILAGGSVTVPSGQTLVTSNLTHAGQLDLDGTLVAGGGLTLEGNATLTGHGTIAGRVSSTSIGVGVTVSDGETLTLGDANHMDGVALDGTIIVGSMGGPASTLILLDANRATIGITRLHAGALLDAPRGITLLPGRTLNALGNALVDGDFTNSGTVNGPTGAGQVLSFNDNVNGAGNYTGNIAFLQGFSPGASPAAVSLENLAFNALSTLTIELGGTTTGSEFDQLVIGGDVALGSAALDVVTLDGFVPSAGQSFEILDIAGTRTGLFAGLEEGDRAASFGSTNLLITYLGGDGNDVALLAAAATLAGDFNHDGSVDAADYAVWRQGLGLQYSHADYNVWRANFGRVAAAVTEPAAADSAVPESSTVVLSLLGAIGMLCCRPRLQQLPRVVGCRSCRLVRRCQRNVVLVVVLIAWVLGGTRPARATDFFRSLPAGPFANFAFWTPLIVPPGEGGPGNADDTVNFDLGFVARYEVTGVAGANDRLLVHNDTLTLSIPATGNMNDVEYTLLNPAILTPSFTVGVASGDVGDVILSGGSGAVFETETTGIGHAPGSTGRVTVANLQWNSNGTLYVGWDGAGHLSIQNTADVSTVDGTIAGRHGSSGSVTVVGAGSTFTTSNELTVGNAGVGTLRIEAGGDVSSNFAIVGDVQAANGSVTVTGAGSTWTNTTSIQVGVAGTGSLSIADSGSVSDTDVVIGFFAGSTGTATVDGAGSMWTNSGNFTVGDIGDGTLTVQNGGSVTNAAGVLGSAIGSTGTVTVTGAGSTWTNSDLLRVGFSGTGELTIEAGGSVSNTEGYIGAGVNSTGTATVTGSGSTWISSSNFFVANFGTGTLTIEAGGSVSNTDGFLGFVSGSTGTATVTGSGSTWTNSGDFVVGNSGAGTLTIEAGGSVSNTIGVIANSFSSTGTATVTGENSTWTNSSDLAVGFSGAGTLTIEDGGDVSNSDGIIGFGSGSTGAVTVTGAGSTWTNSSDLAVGQFGTGTLTITDNGAVVVGGSLFANASSEVHLDGGKLTIRQFGAGGAGALDWQAGTLRLTGMLGLTIGAGGPFGTVMLLDQSQILEVDHALAIDSTAVLFAASGLNAGSVTIAAGGQVFVGGASQQVGSGLTNHGHLVITQATTFDDPVTNASGGAVTALADVTFNGPVNGPGGFFGPGAKNFNGGYSPGASPAVITFEDGDLALGAANTLAIELGGTFAGEWDRLNILGDAQLGGDLAVSLISSFALTADQTFTILDVDGILSGQFTGMGEGAVVGNFDGIDLLITYASGDGNDVALFTQVAALAGDFNYDGSVDAADYAVWRNGLGTQYSQTDYNTWRANFGRVASSAAAVNPAGPSQLAVPESSTLVLLAFGAFGLSLCRQKLHRPMAPMLSLALVTTMLTSNAARADLVAASDPATQSETTLRLISGQTFTSTTASKFDGALTNNGTVYGPTAEAEFLTFTDQVKGAGDYHGNIAFDGHFSPGNSPAVVEFEGNLSFGPANILTVELGGTALGQFDRLEVSGNMGLGGTLAVQLINPFTPSVGNVFEIIDVGGTLSGQFAGLIEGGVVGTFGDVNLQITYMGGDGNDVTLQATAVPEPAWVAGLGILAACLWGYLFAAGENQAAKK